MRRLLHRLAPALAAALLLLAGAARPARADDVADAEALIRQGVQLRQQGNAPRALPLFEKAYQTSRSPRTAAQLGLVELELGYCVEAERYLTEALAVPDHPWIAKNKGTLKRQLEAARKDIGELVVTGSPAGAEIWVNHKVAGKLPLAAPIRLDKGHVDIEVRAANYAAVEDAATIAAGKQVQRNYVLAPEPPAPTPAVAVTAVPEPAPAGSGPAETLTSAPPPAKGSIARPLFWVTAGAAAAALAFGVGEAISAAAKRNDFNNHTTTVGGTTYQDCGTANLSASCQPLKQAYDQAYTLSVVGFVAAGALAAGASALFILSRGERAGAADTRGSAGASTHAFGCVPDPLSRGLTCNLRF
jgi:PEGA domain-containing protein